MDIARDARRDFLTDLYMKEELDPILMQVKADCKVYKRPFSMLVIDLDHFKSYNDKYGHLDGDEVLKYFSSTLRLSLDEGECIPFRFGGDEFIILFPGKNIHEAHAVAEDLRKNLRKRPFLMRGRVFKMSFSGGLVSYPSDGEDVNVLLEKADKAMYYSKTHGRNKTTMYNKMWMETFKRTSFFLVFAVIIYAIIHYGSSAYNIRIENVISKIRGVEPVRIALSALPVNIEKGDEVTVCLKSGGIYKGAIIGENNKAVQLKLALERGEGMISIKRSDIEKIDKPAADKKANKVNGN